MRLRKTAACAVAIAFCFGCSREGIPAARAPEAERAGTPGRDGGTLVRRLEADISSLNPVLATSRYDRFVANYLFTPLVYLDQDLRPIPGLADWWEIAPDGRTYRFRLHADATFSDGSPVRASDVLFTLRKIVDPASEAMQIGAGFQHLDLRRTKVIDDRTIVIAFRERLASQLLRFNDLLVLPERVYGKGDFRNDFNRMAVGSGPYRLVAYQPGREVVVERRGDYWGESPRIGRVVFKILEDHGTAWSALKRGDIDESFVPTDTWLRARADAGLSKKLDLLLFYTLNYNAIAWNTRNPRLASPKIRRALAAAIPVDSLIRNVYQGTARAMTGPFTRDQFAFNPNVPPIAYDPAAARAALLAEGWKDTDQDGTVEDGGEEFVIELLVMSGSAMTRQFAETFQSELGAVGVKVRVTTLDSATAIQRMLAGEFDAAYLSWDLDPDPDPFPILHSSQFPTTGQNFVFYRNPEADRLIEGARRELDPSRRQKLYRDLHELLASDQPYTWTLQGSSKWAISRRVQGVKLSRGFGLFLWYPGEFAWWLSEDAAPARVN